MRALKTFALTLGGADTLLMLEELGDVAVKINNLTIIPYNLLVITASIAEVPWISAEIYRNSNYESLSESPDVRKAVALFKNYPSRGAAISTNTPFVGLQTNSFSFVRESPKNIVNAKDALLTYRATSIPEGSSGTIKLLLDYEVISSSELEIVQRMFS